MKKVGGRFNAKAQASAKRCEIVSKWCQRSRKVGSTEGGRALKSWLKRRVLRTLYAWSDGRCIAG